MTAQAFRKWVILLECNRNRDYSAQNLCANRTKPQLKCGGKCQLTKALEKKKRKVPLSLNSQAGLCLNVICAGYS